MILDSDILVDILRKQPDAVKWALSGPSDIKVAGIAVLEVLYGAGSTVELQRTESVIAKFQVAWPAANDAIHARKLSVLSLSSGLGILDALIAACAIRTGEPLGTFNIKHFGAIEGLTIIQPYKWS